MDKKIIALAGEIACGKGAISKYLIEKYGAKRVGFSDCLRDILGRLYIDQSRDNFQKLSTAVRENFGEDLFSKVVLEDAKKEDAHLILLDGARRESDLKYLRELSGFYLIYIDADIKIRYERIVQRGEKIDEAQKTLEEFVQDHEREPEKQIMELKDIANFVIDNNGSEDELIAQVDEIMKNII